MTNDPQKSIAAEIISGLGVPVFNAPGNHDFATEPEALLHDAHEAFEAQWLDGLLGLSLRVNNLLDTPASDFLSRPLPGRELVLSVTLTEQLD